MFPSKGTMDYNTEINRLFTRNDDNVSGHCNIPSIYTTHQSYFQTVYNQTIANSSSSADSNSPATPSSLGYSLSPPAPRSETPQIKRQRPIVGRRIIESSEPMVQQRRIEYNEPIFGRRIIESTEPRNIEPKMNYMPMQNWDQFKMQQDFHSYELFPEVRAFQTPKSQPSFYMAQEPAPRRRPPSPPAPRSPPRRPPSVNLSPAAAGYSPSGGFSQFSPSPPRRTAPSTGPLLCTFCRKNGETPLVYTMHTLKERIGNRNVVTCPILRNHKCDTCGATGDNAHTKTYCPVQRSSNFGRPLQPTTVILKNTRVKSNGRRRY